jgi:hypothetical protein
VSANTITVHANGSNDAVGRGAGLDLEGGSATPPSTIRNSTLANNAIRARADPASGTAQSRGGGAYLGAGDVLLLNSTVARNSVHGSGHLDFVQGGGFRRDSGTVKVESTILALNTAITGKNCYGTVSSGGHNLLNSTNGCTFASKPSDQLNKDPKLGPLADNGGPTRTLALLNGSPAINRIPKPACKVQTDQRGVHRPQGPACDEGSFERKT